MNLRFIGWQLTAENCSIANVVHSEANIVHGRCVLSIRDELQYYTHIDQTYQTLRERIQNEKYVRLINKNIVSIDPIFFFYKLFVLNTNGG